MSDVAVIAGLLVLFAVVARRLDRWSITPAIAFTAAGAALGPDGLGVLELGTGAEATKLLIEFTLAIILFGDATSVDPRAARGDAPLIGRLLLVGLPLTIVAGTLGAAGLLPGLSWAEAGVLGALLAPTDAALGLAVLTNRAVPARVRRVLNVESGLNDGIATPVVTVLIAAAVSEVKVGGTDWVVHSVEEIAKGLAIGIGAGAVGALVLLAASRRGWSTAQATEIGVLALAIGSYSAAVAASGNGFVAAFVAGLAFRVAGRGALHERVEYAEATGQVLAMVVWTVFGAGFAAAALADGVEWRPIVYALVSLTVVRMLPVAVALVRTGLRRETVLFMGWFGPRGLASVVFTLLLIIEVDAAGGDPPRDLVLAATWTILLSVVLHGLSAGTLSRRYGDLVERLGPGLAETEGPEPTGGHLAPGRRTAHHATGEPVAAVRPGGPSGP